MKKLIYLESYFLELCKKYNEKEVENKNLLNDFLFNATEKGTLYARYKLIANLKINNY